MLNLFSTALERLAIADMMSALERVFSSGPESSSSWTEDLAADEAFLDGMNKKPN
jgi:hypothetical protein